MRIIKKSLFITILLIAVMSTLLEAETVFAGCKRSHKIGCDDAACSERHEDDKECKYSCDECDPADTSCQTGEYTNMESCGGGGEQAATAAGPTATPIPTPTCNPYPFKSGGIEPNRSLPGGDVLVTCGFGADLDCLSVTGGGLTNCTQRTYANGETVFACKAGYNPGVYTDTKCVKAAGTRSNCCAGEAYNKILGEYTTLSTAAHFVQKARIPAGDYVLLVRAYTVIAKGNGAFVDVLCANPDCGGGKKENDSLGKIVLPANTDFETKTLRIKIPDDGNNKDYRIRIVAGEGSELYVDRVSFAGGGKEYVLNGEFKNVASTPSSVTLDQPVSWGDGSNKIGYFYGMAINNKLPPVGTPGGSSSSGGASSGGTSSSGGGTSSIPGAQNMKLDIKLKLQGVAKKPITASPITVKVKLGGRMLAQTTAYKTVTFSVGDDGIWSGSADFSAPPGDGYMLYVKGPKHLQKKVCDNAATEGSGGTYHCGDGKINLKAGDNALDFSKILMLVGDLPENGTQNGIIDSYDTSYVRQHLQSTKTDELAIGDVNYDGVIDGQDFSLVLASLSIKYDEE